MKNRYFVYIFLILVLPFLFISNIKATSLPTLEDYSLFSYGYGICEYSYDTDKVWCFRSSGYTPMLYKSNDYINQYNPEGYLFSGSWFWVAYNSTYQSSLISYWDGTSWISFCQRNNRCNIPYNRDSNSYITYYKPEQDSNDFYYPLMNNSSHTQVLDFYATISNPYIFPPAVSNPFTISYEQAEVLMAGSQNSANLVTMNLISTNVSPVDYIFTYSYRINENETPTNYTFMPICSTLVDSNEDIQYTCYYNIPMYYNTDIHFSIIEKESITEIYSYDLTAYLSILPNTSYYNIYAINGYKYINISNINSGTFALQNDLVNNIALAGHTAAYPIKIYVYDYFNNTKVELETTNYFISKTTSNGYTYFNFDFNGDINKFITIELLYPELYENQNYKYIYVPKMAYVHLSALVECSDDSSGTCQDLQNNPVNQQSYKDSEGNIHYVDNPINYDDGDINRFNNSFSSLFNSFYQEFAFIGNFISILFSNIPAKLTYTIFFMFGLIVVGLTIRIWL